MADNATTDKTERQQRVIARNFGLDMSGFMSNIWAYRVPENQTKDDMLRPEFWADVADKVMGHNGQGGRGDQIRMDKADESATWFARINAIGKGHIKIAFFMETPAQKVEEPVGPLKTRWNVGKQVHEVVRASGDVLASGFQQKADAIAWINKHTQDMAA